MKTHTLMVKGDLTSDDFLPHFTSMLQNPDSTPSIHWSMPYFTDAFLDSPIELCEIIPVIKNLKLNKAPGQDGICYEFYKFASDGFINEILTIFNRIFLHEQIPTSFRRSILIPLFKTGDPNLSTNYRGLSLMDTLCKIFKIFCLIV